MTTLLLSLCTSLIIKVILQVFCYALSQNDGSEWRQRIQSEAEHFVDVSSMSSDMIARMINEDKIQILLNLNGYTKVFPANLFSEGCLNAILHLLQVPTYSVGNSQIPSKYLDIYVTVHYIRSLIKVK